MNIKVHRGLEQIGGCITEISTDTSRVFIDFGQNLPGCGEPATPEQDAKMVEGLFEHDSHKETAVFYTHAHEDHVGLFHYIPDGIPQYIGEGGKAMLIAKYELIKRKDEIEFNVVSTLSQKNDSECQKVSAERLAKAIIADEERIGIIRGFHTWERTKPHAAPKPIQIGDIRITPFFNCHSIYDSYMFLIEADGKRIWHMGDYREHGYMGKGLLPTLKRYASDIDVLITEGTMLKRDDECIHEREVFRKMASVMDAFKYVVVLASATDIERLASIKEAAKKAGKRLYINGGLMKRTMKLFTEREAKLSKGLFDFHPIYLNPDNEKMIATMQKNGFVLISGVNGLGIAEEPCEGVDPSEVLLIYSSWDGYYKKPEQVKLNPLYKEFRSRFANVVDIHTSGHASKETIRKIINIVKPKEVICMHKEADAELLL
ncbi:MAG: MBL fold metallo-hydrolase [Bacteroidaceae bacterium]|nr:MBL fold metallo-hydrolase [Bacteroidaceae bacterium]